MACIYLCMHGVYVCLHVGMCACMYLSQVWKDVDGGACTQDMGRGKSWDMQAAADKRDLCQGWGQTWPVCRPVLQAVSGKDDGQGLGHLPGDSWDTGSRNLLFGVSSHMARPFPGLLWDRAGGLPLGGKVPCGWCQGSAHPYHPCPPAGCLLSVLTVQGPHWGP